MNLFSIMKKTDLAAGYIFLVLAGYSFYQLNWMWSVTWAVAAVVSFLSAKYVPVKWILRKMLFAKLKA